MQILKNATRHTTTRKITGNRSVSSTSVRGLEMLPFQLFSTLTPNLAVFQKPSSGAAGFDSAVFEIWLCLRVVVEPRPFQAL